MDSPMCLVENADGELHVVPGAIKYLMGLNQQVVVVAVVGLYRTGKSYLMNKLAGKRKGFALGATIQSKTKGIWMWCVPHPEKRDHTLVLLDTEGLGDVEKGDSKNDAWIFSLAILLSSTLVYNSRGTIDNQAVENLQQNLMYNLPRECIRNYFPSRKCFVFPTPTTPANMPHLDSMDEADLCGSFRKVADTFCRFIFQESRTKTVKGGHKVAIAKHYADLLIQNEDASEKKCAALLEKLSAPMAQKIKEGIYATPGGYELYCNHHDNMVAQYRAEPEKGVRAEEILEQFLKEKSLEKNSILQADKKLTENEKKIHEEKERSAVLEQEKKAAEEKRVEMERTMEDDRRSKDEKLRQMEEKMKEEMKQQERDFHRALECKMQEQKDLLEKGHKEKADLMRQEIEEFKKSNKPEKEGGEEQEKRALAEQAVKMEAEKQHQLEKLIQERERSHQEGIRQLEAKMVQEAKEKQQELERALDSKLHEQEKLTAKGFTEKEAAMKEEIQSLREKEEAKREEKEEQSRNFRAIAQGVIESVSNGLGHYYNYRKAREERKAIVLKESVRSTSKLKSGSVGSIPDMERMTLKQDKTTTPKLKMGAVGNSKDNKTLPKVNTGTTSKSPGSEF
ncbi:unnamed protein product [Coregonus sp. 'balchen']|nr:unnamed protein product [Coregonus sp. 'balchen']